VKRTTLILCIHNHQPVGNLPHVFEEAYERAYRPFLDALERHPGVRLVLHNTGPLLEWYEQHAPDYLERVAALVETGRVELLSGGFYEPILSGIPARDAVGQIRKLTDYTEQTFGTRPRGMWLAERVWQPELASVVARAGIEYLPLDDYEFRLAGLADEDLTGDYLTEHENMTVRVFPISKELRYRIPFQEPERTLDFMQALADRGFGLTAVFGDDGEKFGIWPGTYEHVHTGGWLERFFEAIEGASDWLETATFADVVDRKPPKGRVYLPTSSYPEMMEWALPTPARRTYSRLLHELDESGRGAEWRPFLSGGIWKNFLTKYEESNLMVQKMWRVSDKLWQAERAGAGGDVARELGEGTRAYRTMPDAAAMEQARADLWRGQCNCAYWHGVFGGLYLPHLRSAIFEHLIRAENGLEADRAASWDSLDVKDHDLDGRDEVLMETHWADVYVAPARGGAIFEMDLRGPAVNILGTMRRYEEAYHDDLVRATAGAGDGTVSIHDMVVAKEEGLEAFARPDDHARWAAIDRFLAKDASAAAMEDPSSEQGDLVESGYEFEPVREPGSVGVRLSKRGMVHDGGLVLPIEFEKTITLGVAGTLTATHSVRSDADLELRYASEWNLAFLTGHGDYAGVLVADERRALDEPLSFDAVPEVRFEDLLRNCALEVRLEPEAEIWMKPLETASQSEAGFERVFQGVTVWFVWPFTARGGAPRKFRIALSAKSL
jgi:alpha-amylase